MTDEHFSVALYEGLRNKLTNVCFVASKGCVGKHQAYKRSAPSCIT